MLNDAPVSVEATSGEEEEAEISGEAEVDVGLNGMWEEDPTWEDLWREWLMTWNQKCMQEV